MDRFNYSNARAQLSMLMDIAAGGQAVEITRQGREPAVIISKAAYEAYKKAQFEANCAKEYK
ncbi:type II toxin-antitoxin system Phd/YefM family antitoxin [Acinetobacter vivianii]|uniref:type II toxin-antitoxin system Phd/YefM family antitoxin n=1 Tax=Acinetobacter vivianii TaxID=1776742 RepID=UPI003CFDA968